MTAKTIIIKQAANGFVVNQVDSGKVVVFENGNEIEMFQFIEKHFGFKVIIYDNEEDNGKENPFIASATKPLSDKDI